jgi:tetratricopeptide (TPR) repeat protein
MKSRLWIHLAIPGLILGSTWTVTPAVGAVLNPVNRPVSSAQLVKSDNGTVINQQSQGAIDLYNKGIAKYQAGNLVGALKDFEEALKIQPKFVEALVNSANVLDDLGKTAEAIDKYGLALAQSPADANIYYNRGLAYSRLQQYPKALSDYSKSITLNPEYPFPYQGRGLLKYEKLGDKKGGLQDLKTAAEIYQRQGDKNKAEELMKLYQKLNV